MSMLKFILAEIGIVLGTLVISLVAGYFYMKWSDRRMGINKKG